MTQDLMLESDGPVWFLTINRPEVGNTFTLGMIDEWDNHLVAFSKSPDAQVLVLTGVGEVFSRGLDIGHLPVDAPAPEFFAAQQQMHRIARTMAQIDKPIIAAVNGAAVGAGMDMALLCDIIFMANSAVFCEGYVRAGLVAGGGGAWMLAKKLGTARALELLWTAKNISAKDCVSLGLANRVCAETELISEAVAFATELTQRSQHSLRLTKQMVYEAEDMTLLSAMSAAASHMAVVQSTEASQKLLMAFRENRAKLTEEPPSA